MYLLVLQLRFFGGEEGRVMHFIREHNSNKALLSSVGLWPYQSKMMRNLIPAVCVVLELSYLPFEILIFYDHPGDMNMMFESFCQIAVTFAFLSRAVNHFGNQNKMRWLHDAMDNHWNIFSSDMEIKVLQNHALTSRKFVVCYATLMYSMTSILIMNSLTPLLLDVISPLNESRARAFMMEVDFKIDTNKYYAPLSVYTIFLVIVGITFIVGDDSMYVTCCIHACGLFSIIGQQIGDFSSVNKDDQKVRVRGYEFCTNAGLESSSDETLYRKYIICLKKYQLAIKFVDMLNSWFRMTALFCLLLIGVSFSIIAIRIVDVLGEIEEMARFIFILTGVLMQLMLICYSGQRIIDECHNIFDRVYAAEWYNLSPRIKSLLIITLYRSMVPCRLTAGDMVPLSMATYAAVIRMGLSYFTTFLSLKD